MIERFQCPGCMVGSDTKCGSFKPSNGYGASCKGHVLGTAFGGFNNKIALGLPKGFNKPGVGDDPQMARSWMYIRLWTKGAAPEWDHLNIPVWAMIEGGYLFVRTYSPRLNAGYVDVIEQGDWKMLPTTINVADFVNDID